MIVREIDIYDQREIYNKEVRGNESKSHMDHRRRNK